MNDHVKRKIRKSITYLGFFSGINYVFQKIVRYILGPKLIIVGYHRVVDGTTKPDLFAVSKRSFERQILFLKSNYKVITFRELIDNKVNHCDSKDYVIITVDDGHKESFTHAAPILHKHKVSACFFIPTELIDHVPNDANRVEDIKKYPGMTRKDLQQMQAMGFEIGAHTMSHAVLLQLPRDQCPERDQRVATRPGSAFAVSGTMFCLPRRKKGPPLRSDDQRDCGGGGL